MVTLEGMSEGTVGFETLLLELACLMLIEAALAVPTVWEKTALK